MKGYKVLVDANILVSASICYTCKDFGLKHRFYDKCKTLINLFNEKVDEKIGFYTKLIDVASDRVLREAILSTIKEVSQNDQKVDEEKLLEVLFVIYTESVRRLEENKDLLVRETINEDKITTLMGEILHFFNFKIKKELEKQNPGRELARARKLKASSEIMKIVKFAKIEEAKRLFPHYGTLKRKFIDSSPGIGDIKLLAQAIYFDELFSKKKIKFYLTSTDHHFVRIDKNGKINDFVPILIKEEFGVECLNPEQTLKIIK